MKKIIIILFIIILSGCTKNVDMKKIEINSDNCQIKEEKDTHGGFLGDGAYFAKISCPNLELGALSSNWKVLPLSEKIMDAVSLIMCDDKDCSDIFSKYQIPEIKDGYYYFVDRHTDANDKYDDKYLNSRSSYNYSLAMCDINNKTIYYYELDT